MLRRQRSEQYLTRSQSRSHFLRHTNGRAQWAQVQACAQQRSQALQALGAQLQGQIEQVEVLPLAHYRPWPRRGGWQAVALPSGQEALDALPLLAQ